MSESPRADTGTCGPRSSQTGNIERGAKAEQAALDYLSAKGLNLVARNFRTRLGELDLVMRHTEDGRESLVFVEVKMRSRSDYGGAAASVTPQKQQRLARAAQLYLRRHRRWADTPCRFDVVTMNGAGSDIHWIRAAFSL